MENQLNEIAEQLNEIALFAKKSNFDLSNDEGFDKMMKAWLYNPKSAYNNKEETVSVVRGIIKMQYGI